jgi:hypothetical protein
MHHLDHILEQYDRLRSNDSQPIAADLIDRINRYDPYINDLFRLNPHDRLHISPMDAIGYTYLYQLTQTQSTSRSYATDALTRYMSALGYTVSDSDSVLSSTGIIPF